MTDALLAGESDTAFAEPNPTPCAATVVAETEVTVGKWSYAGLNNASPELQTKLPRLFFRLTAARLKHADEQYLALYRQHLQATRTGEMPAV